MAFLIWVTGIITGAALGPAALELIIAPARAWRYARRVWRYLDPAGLPRDIRRMVMRCFT